MRMSSSSSNNGNGGGGGGGTVLRHKGGSTLSNSNSVAGYGSNARRVVFTGTPLQNNAMEIYTLVEFVCPLIFRVYPRVIFNQKVEIIEKYIRSITLQDLAKATTTTTAIATLEDDNDERGGVTQSQRMSCHVVAEGSSQNCTIDVDAEDDEDEQITPTSTPLPRLSSCLKAAATSQQPPPPRTLHQRRRDLEEAVDAQSFVVNWMQGFVFRDISAGYVDHAKPQPTKRNPIMPSSQKKVGVSSPSGLQLGEDGPGPEVLDPVATAAALPLYDFIIVCGSSQAQIE